jgi:hypothetical protein
MNSCPARLIGPMVSKARGKRGGFWKFRHTSFLCRCAADSAAEAAVVEDADK